MKSTFLAAALVLVLSGGTLLSQSLLFQSGFENDVRVKEHAWMPDLIGADRTLSAPNDWQTDLEKDGRKFFFNFCNNVTKEDMGVEIVNDPAGGTNKVLRMYQRNVPLANNPGNKTRVQAELRVENPDIMREFFQQWRLYIHPDIKKLESFPGSRKEGPQLMELDCADAGCGRYRIIVTLQIPGNGSPLKWNVWCHTLCSPRQTYWQVIRDTTVPYGEWITMRMHWKSNAGKEANGKFSFSYESNGNPETFIADISGKWVTYPQATGWGIRSWKPFVWYNAGQDETHYIRDHGGLAQLFVDDFRLWNGKPSTGATSLSVMPAGDAVRNVSALKPAGICQSAIVLDLCGRELQEHAVARTHSGLKIVSQPKAGPGYSTVRLFVLDNEKGQP